MTRKEYNSEILSSLVPEGLELVHRHLDYQDYIVIVAQTGPREKYDSVLGQITNSTKVLMVETRTFEEFMIDDDSLSAYALERGKHLGLKDQLY